MVTFASIREQARFRSDMQRTNFVTEDELKTYVNNSIKELYDLLVGTFDDYYIKEPLQFTLTTENTYELPADFYKLRGLDRSIDNSGNESSWFTVSNFNFLERNRYNVFNSVQGTYPLVKYRVFGANLKFIPQNNAAGLYQLWYVPRFEDLVADDDEFDGINGWEEYVIVDAAIKMLSKEESDTAELEREKKALMDRIEAMAADRDASQPERITDARSNTGFWPTTGGTGNW